MSDASLKGFSKVASSVQSKWHPVKPSGAEPERDARITDAPCCLRRGAMREEVLPVPPVRRIVISSVGRICRDVELFDERSIYILSTFQLGC